MNEVSLSQSLGQVSVPKPVKSFATAVKYRGFWFYLDERDQTSLSIYSLPVELFGIEVRAGGGGGFLYTRGI